MRRVWSFAPWLLTIVPLTFLGVIIHVLAWALEASLDGGIVEELFIWPTSDFGGVTWGAIVLSPQARHPVWFALAPSMMWTLIAGVGIGLHAWRGRTRWISLERALYVLLIVLPVLAIVMETSCAFTARPWNGVELHPHRWWLAGVVVPLCAAIVAAGWMRFRALFPRARAAHYAAGWTAMIVAGALARNSGAVWSLIGRLAVL